MNTLGTPGFDVLTGTPAHDVFVGGAGPDRFVFMPGLSDTVADFHGDRGGTGHGALIGDILDFSHIGRHLHFVDRFTGHAGEVRIDGHAVRVDTDGDGHADFLVHVHGAVHDHDLVLL